MLINSVGGGGGIELSLVISVASGSVVTAVKGGRSVTGTAVDGVCVLMVPEAGVWTVSATLGGKTTPAQTVTVKSKWEAALEYDTPLGELAVGSSVFANVNGVRTEFLVVNQGKPSDLYEDSCDGTWLLMKDCYESRAWHSSNVNKYESSSIHSYLNSTFLNLFESAVKDAIKQVKVPYRQNGGSGGTDQSGETGLSCKIFLLSGYEVGFTTSNSRYFPIDGARLSYFDLGNGTSANNKRIAKCAGAADTWWLRSPNTGLTDYAFRVYTDGKENTKAVSELSGIRPALVLPSTLLRSDDGTISV